MKKTILSLAVCFSASCFAQSGNLDSSFGNNGIVTAGSIFTCTAVQTDGKILSAGYNWNGIDNDFAIARYNLDGSPDYSFSGTGNLVTDFSATDDQAKSIAIQPDGKIIIAGFSGNNFALARYNTNGSLDNSFGTGGKLITSYSSPILINAIALQPDGKIIAGGTTLLRYNPNGSIDNSFNAGGQLITQFVDGKKFNCAALALQTDGKIIIIGNDGAILVARYNSNGIPDSSFGNRGIRPIWALEDPNAITIGSSVAMDNEGRIIIGGTYQYAYRTINYARFTIIRLKNNAAYDTEFNGDGRKIQPINAFDLGTSIQVQPDNKIILAGHSTINYKNFTVCRYATNGSLDSSFGINGTQVTNACNADNSINAICLAGNKLYAAGYGKITTNVGILARYMVEDLYLPVTLVNFTGTLQKKSVLLQWKTSTENKLNKFIVQRSTNNSSFDSIANVTATGNSNAIVDYSLTDNKALKGKSFYRLKMLANNGTFTYSDTATILYKVVSFDLAISPNPARNNININVKGDINEMGIVEILDGNGYKYIVTKTELNGKRNINVNIRNLPTGIYYVHIVGNSIDEKKRFLKL